MINLLISLLILNLMVITHEFGHYLFARKNGIEVSEFAIGFGPTLFAWTKFGTKWMIKAIPLGGYNGMKGEAEAEKGKGNFITAPKKAKLQVLFAGSLTNLIVAIFAFYIALGVTGWKTDLMVQFNPVGAVVTNKDGGYPWVVGYTSDSNLAKLGVAAPFEVVSVNGNATNTADDIIKYVDNSPSDVIEMKILKDGSSQTLQSLRNANHKLGIQIVDPMQMIDYSTTPLNIAFSGVSHSINVVIMTGKILGLVVGNAIKTHDATPLGYAFAGPVAIVATVGEVVKDSKHVFADLASLTGMIGVSLAVFNLLPFPGLDGWHIFLVGYEKVRGHRANERIVNLVTAFGLIFLLVLGVLIMFKDYWLFFLKK